MSISASIANDKLVELRNKKKKAIQSLDFDAAEENDRQIQMQNDLIISDRIDKINNETLKEIHRHVKKYDEINAGIDEHFNKQEKSLQLKYQELFNKAQIQFEKESDCIDESHGAALLREAEREVPEQFELLEQAKAAAAEGNYSSAKQLRDQARTAGENELRRRKQQVDYEFEQSHSILEQKYQDRTTLIETNFKEETDSLHAEFELHKHETEQRADASIQLIKERAHSKFETLIPDQETRENAELMLFQKIDKIIIEAKTNPKKTTNSLNHSQKNMNRSSNASSTRSPSRLKNSSQRLGISSKYSSIP